MLKSGEPGRLGMLSLPRVEELVFGLQLMKWTFVLLEAVHDYMIVEGFRLSKSLIPETTLVPKDIEDIPNY